MLSIVAATRCRLTRCTSALSSAGCSREQFVPSIRLDLLTRPAQLASQQLAAFATAKLVSMLGKAVGGKGTPDLAQPDPIQAGQAGAAYALPITGASVALGVAGRRDVR